MSDVMWESLKGALWTFVKIMILAPFAGHFYLYFIEEIRKAWKANNKKQKWVAYCGFFVITASFLRCLYDLVL